MTVLKRGSQGPIVKAWQERMQAMYGPGYTRAYGPNPVDSYFGDQDVLWQKAYQVRTGQAPSLLEASGVVSEKDLHDLRVSVGAPANSKTRHLAVVFRGTGGIIGEDIVSRTCQGAVDLVEERNPVFPATMGGIPVGASNDPNAPSAMRAAEIGLANGIAEVEAALRTNPERRVIIGGYSWGAYVAARLREWIHETHPENYLCSFSYGDPTRPFGGSGYLVKVPSGQGIGSWHYGDPKDYRHLWLTTEEDMYGNVPPGAVWEIMEDFYTMVVNTQLSDPLGTVQRIIPALLEALADAGAPSIVKSLLNSGDPNLIKGAALPLLAGMLPGLLAAVGGNPDKLTGLGAAVLAAIIAIKFFVAGTAPHIHYHDWDVKPGQTYLGLGIQHVRDWSTRAFNGQA